MKKNNSLTLDTIKKLLSIFVILMICVSGQPYLSWAAQTTTDDEWERITSASELTKDGTYIIVSTGNTNKYLMSANGTTAAATQVTVTQQQNGNYKLNKTTADADQWTFAKSGTSGSNYTVRNDGNRNYLRLSNKIILNSDSNTVSLTYTTGGYWTFNNSDYYLVYNTSDSNFSRSSSTSNTNRRQMQIYRLVESAPEPPEPPVPENPELVVTKEWTDGTDNHEPVKVNLYRKGTAEPVKSMTLSQANSWSGTFTDLDPVSSTELGYSVKEEPVKGYMSEVGAIKRSAGGSVVWVPSRGSTFTNGKEYALYSSGKIITRNGTAGLSVKNVTLGGQIAVNGSVYSSHISDSDVGTTGGWRAQSYSDSFSLSNGGYYMRKDTPMVGTDASTIRTYDMTNGFGYIQFYASDKDKRRYLRINTNGSVDSAKGSSSATKFQLYEKVTNTSASASYSVTITNRPVQDVPKDMPKEWSKKIDYLSDGNTNTDTQERGDDLYRLYLDMNTATQPIDMLLIIDCSTSMGEDDMGGGVTRFDALDRIVNGTVTSGGADINRSRPTLDAGRAADGFIYKFLNANAKNRIAVLGYGNTTKISKNWTDKAGMTASGTAPKNYAVDTTHESIQSGTNYTLALQDAKKQLLDARKTVNPHTVLVFMTDGEANKYVDADGNKQPANSYLNNSEVPGDYANEYLKDHVCKDYPNMPVYIVGVSPDVTTGMPKQILEGMTETARGELYTADNSTELENAFTDILNKQRMVPICFNDKLSVYADFADNPDIKMTMKNKSPNVVKTLWDSSGPTADNKLNGQDIITDISIGGKEIKANINPNLVADTDYVFTLSYNIVSSDTAKKEFSKNGYSDVGDAGTDFGQNNTSSGKEGFHSNESAGVVFKEALTRYDAEFAHPVIQVPKPPEPPKQDIRKWVDAKNDGSYDLSLTVNGLAGGIKPGEKVDILMIVDTTKSMEQNFEGSKSRWDALEDAVEDVVDRLDSGGADARMALVGFSGGNSYSYPSPGNTYADATYNVPWTNNIQSITTALTQLSLGGSTNYEAPFALINRSSILDSARTDAKKIVMFITDGMPNMYYENGHSKDDDDAEWYDDYTNSMTHARNQITQMTGKMDAFYAISVGTSTQLTLLQELQGYSGVNGNAFVCTDSAALDNALSAAFGGTAETTQINGTYIEDVLSSNVELTADAKLTLTVKDSSGSVVKTQTGDLTGTSVTLPATDGNSAVTLTAAYNSADKKITVSSDAEYTLEEGWSYTVTTQIKPSQSAITAYSADKTYPDTGGDKTGTTSDGKQGFKSNDTAKFSYSYYGIGYTQDYNDPVVQILLKKISVRKTDAVDTTKRLDKAEFDLYRQCESTVSGSVAVPGLTGKYGVKVNADAIVSQKDSDVEVDSLQLGTYFLVETKAPYGYNILDTPVELTIDVDGVSTKDSNAYVDSSDSFKLTVKDTKIYKLPNAGGLGTYYLYFIGAMVIVFAGGMINRKVRLRIACESDEKQLYY